jgi:glycolate oxidase FAD binding subunit
VTALWRLSTAPTNGPRLVSLIERVADCRAAYDWSGGLIWLEVPERSDAAAVEIRHALSEIPGHATLLKAPAELRAVVDVFQPPEPHVAALTRRLKQAFDPNGILNPGRMYPGM